MKRIAMAFMALILIGISGFCTVMIEGGLK